jgi:beta-lactamase class A
MKEWLAAGIPASTDVAHKYGREIHVVSDAGIVFADEPFILVLLSKGVVEREADQAFPELSKAIYIQEVK